MHMSRFLKIAIPTGIAGYAKYDISIVYDDVKQVHVDYKLKEEPAIEELNGEYHISVQGKRTWFYRSNGNITITLPTSIQNITLDYVGKLNFDGEKGKSKDVVIKSVGNTLVKNLQADRILFNNTAGSINTENLTANIVDLNSTAGSVKTKNINTHRLYVKVSAGSIESKSNMIGDYCEFKSSAGSIKADVEFKNNGKFYSDTTTGSIEASVKNYKEAELSSSVGAIVADLVPNENSTTKLTASVSSIKANVKGFKGNLNTSASSGRVKLTRNGEKVEFLPGGGDSKYDISIRNGDQPHVQIEYKLYNDEIVQVKDNREISFKGKNRWFKRLNGDIHITLPKTLSRVDIDYIGKLKWDGNQITSGVVNCVGELMINDLNANEFEIKSLAGKVELDHLISKDVKIHSNAGTKLVATNHAGSIETTGIVSEYCEFNCKVGLIKADITTNNGQVVADSNTGTIEVHIKNYLSLDLKSTVGSINADLEPASKSTTSIHASVASIKATISGFKGTVTTSPNSQVLVNGRRKDVPSGDSTIVAKTNAGDIKLNFTD
ncbi:hypothetical protein HDV01_001674 [Terramyces sp. JEL0728]|nr:hypothetical protein HDV01_001674 [Terramyces sp. JEL0728]